MRVPLNVSLQSEGSPSESSHGVVNQVAYTGNEPLYVLSPIGTDCFQASQCTPCCWKGAGEIGVVVQAPADMRRFKDKRPLQCTHRLRQPLTRHALLPALQPLPICMATAPMKGRHLHDTKTNEGAPRRRQCATEVVVVKEPV
jgi:hypothetical protein